MPSSWREGSGRGRGWALAAAVVLVVVQTGIMVALGKQINGAEAALAYLVVVGVVAGSLGMEPALVASLLATIGLAVYFQPILAVPAPGDMDDWLHIPGFIIAALALAILAGRLRTREVAARKDERRSRLLADVAADSVRPRSDPAVRLRAGRAMLESSGAAWLATFVRGPSGPRLADATDGIDVPEAVRAAVASLFDVGDAVRVERTATGRRYVASDWMTTGAGGVLVPLRSLDLVEGAIYMAPRVDGRMFEAEDLALTVALAHIYSLRLEADRLSREMVAEEAARESEQVRETFISSVSHQLKTPLASMKATIGSLLEPDSSLKLDSNVREDLEGASSDIARLEGSINALLEITRLEANGGRSRIQPCEPADIIGPALTGLPDQQRARVQVRVADDIPLFVCDEAQVSRALVHIVENALTYSPSGPVVLGATEGGDWVRIWVEDRGPGIPDGEKELVLGKFQRGAAAASVPEGTGLGLAIADSIARFHGGRVEIADAEPHGARVTLVLPVAPSQVREGTGSERRDRS